MLLVVDLGGTWIRLAIATPEGQLQHLQKSPVADYDSLAEAMGTYLSSLPSALGEVKNAAIGVPGPTNNNDVQLTNLPRYSFEKDRLQKQLNLISLIVMNDAAAIAAAIPALRSSGKLAQLGGGDFDPLGSVAMICPGTGLGVSYLVPDGRSGWIPVSTEGGNVGLSVAREDFPLVEAISESEKAKWGSYISAEYFLSGPGLVRLYFAGCALEGIPSNPYVTPEAITASTDPHSMEYRSTERFMRLLGSFAGDLTLTLGAVGGVYFSGSIITALKDRLRSPAFRNSFEDKGRYQQYMERIPTYHLEDAEPALIGLMRHFMDSPYTS